MNVPDLVDMFKDATQGRPYGYLFFDFTQECPDDVRIRSNIFGEMMVYKQV